MIIIMHVFEHGFPCQKLSKDESQRLNSSRTDYQNVLWKKSSSKQYVDNKIWNIGLSNFHIAKEVQTEFCVRINQICLG